MSKGEELTPEEDVAITGNRSVDWKVLQLDEAGMRGV